MDAVFSSIRLADLFARVKLVILHPQKCWETISQEQPTARVLSLSLIAPLAVVAVLGPVIGHKIFGVDVEYFGLWRAPLFFSLTNQSLEIAMMITSLFIDGWLLHKLAPQFYRSVSFDKAFSIVAHASIPAFLAWGVGIIPGLLRLKFFAFAYSFYLLFFGLQRMLEINPNAPKNDSLPALFSCALALMLLVHVIMHGLVEPMTPSPFLDIL
jgi:Yip1 domain